MRASEEIPTFYFHLILGAFIIRTLPDSGCSPPQELIDRGKKKMDGWISFFPPSDGASDQYSHCWLSFGNLYDGASHRSIARNCLHFQIKRSFFRFFRQWRWGLLPKRAPNRLVSVAALLSLRPSVILSSPPRSEHVFPYKRPRNYGGRHSHPFSEGTLRGNLRKNRVHFDIIGSGIIYDANCYIMGWLSALVSVCPSVSAESASSACCPLTS